MSNACMKRSKIDAQSCSNISAIAAVSIIGLCEQRRASHNIIRLRLCTLSLSSLQYGPCFSLVRDLFHGLVH